MYNLTTRYKYSAIIPCIVFAYSSMTFVIKTDYLKFAEKTQIIENIATYFITAVVIYIVTVLFFSLETIIRAYITDRTSQLSIKIRKELRAAPLKKKLQILEEYDKQIQQRSVVKSVLFQSGLLALLLAYSVSNTKLNIGISIALSIYLQLIIEQIKEMKQKKNIASWFWQIATQVTPKNQAIYLGINIIIYTAILISKLKI